MLPGALLVIVLALLWLFPLPASATVEAPTDAVVSLLSDDQEHEDEGEDGEDDGEEDDEDESEKDEGEDEGGDDEETTGPPAHAVARGRNQEETEEAPLVESEPDASAEETETQPTEEVPSNPVALPTEEVPSAASAPVAAPTEAVAPTSPPVEPPPAPRAAVVEPGPPATTPVATDPPLWRSGNLDLIRVAPGTAEPAAPAEPLASLAAESVAFPSINWSVSPVGNWELLRQEWRALPWLVRDSLAIVTMALVLGFLGLGSLAAALGVRNALSGVGVPSAETETTAVVLSYRPAAAKGAELGLGEKAS